MTGSVRLPDSISKLLGKLPTTYGNDQPDFNRGQQLLAQKRKMKQEDRRLVAMGADKGFRSKD